MSPAVSAVFDRLPKGVTTAPISAPSAPKSSSVSLSNAVSKQPSNPAWIKVGEVESAASRIRITCRFGHSQLIDLRVNADDPRVRGLEVAYRCIVCSGKHLRTERIPHEPATPESVS